MVKLLENTFRSVNIGLVNELAIICEKLGVEVWEVIRAAATKPFGFMPFWPGPGLGGHCIPIDPHYLSWKLKTLNYHARFIELADEINSSMPTYVVDRVAEALNDHSRSVRGSRVLILGVAYKKNVDDCRESPAIDVIAGLQNRGAHVVYADPYVPSFTVGGAAVECVPYDTEQLKAAHCVVIVTDHSEFDAATIVEMSSMVVDTRNVTGSMGAQPNVRKL
jgi:UDP-N-acetyl-D-glucosamine dehydrogenase